MQTIGSQVVVFIFIFILPQTSCANGILLLKGLPNTLFDTFLLFNI